VNVFSTTEKEEQDEQEKIKPEEFYKD